MITKTELLENIAPKNQATDRKFNDKLVALAGDLHDAINAAKTEVIAAVEAILTDYFKFAGIDTAVNIASIETPSVNLLYKVSTGGEINTGEDVITATTGDLVYFNGTIWAFLVALS